MSNKINYEWQQPRNLEYAVGDDGSMIVLALTCPRCENEPKYILENKKTGELYSPTYCPTCESQLKKVWRLKKKGVDAIEPLAAPQIAALAEADVETVGDLLDLRDEGFLADVDGIGAKSVEAIDEWLEAEGLVEEGK